jgi:hypothetical protein
MKTWIIISNARVWIVRLFLTVMLIFTTAIMLRPVTLSDLSSRQKISKVTVPEGPSGNFDLLPDGKPFAFWGDKTKYTKELHVARNNPQASDDNPGTIERPLKTINAAAQILQPGEKVIVHEGVYRECIQPARGGTSPDKMISYEVAEGEKVIVRGSEIWEPQFRPSSGFGIRFGPRIPSSDTPPADDIKIWMADIPVSFFIGYNPFTVRNTYRYISRWGRAGEPEWLARALLYRGAVYVDGKPLKQVLGPAELAQNENAFWAEDPGLRLHIRLSKDVDPSTVSFEVTAREQIFAPKEFGLGYIRISGFAFEHAADGPPVPQRAAVSTMRGHHWIIENNRIEWCNAEGIDLGSQDFVADRTYRGDGHIVRNNIIRNIGICGIAGPGLDNILIEKNLIENVGLLDLERNCESAGLKFHGPHNTLIRQNIFRHINNASGIWFDVATVNSRIVNNVFADITTLFGGVWMEINFEQNLVDHNIFWDIHNDILEDPTTPAPDQWAFGNGTAIRSDCNEKLIIAHNLFGKCTEHAISLNVYQSTRIVAGRTGIGYANKVVNNIFFDTPNRIYLAMKYENFIDGNLYDSRDDRGGPFLLNYPEPPNWQNLAGWQEFFGFDKHSTQAGITADFDPETCILEISIEGKTPECQSLGTIMNGRITSGFPGPFMPDQAQKSQGVIKIRQKFPVGL